MAESEGKVVWMSGVCAVPPLALLLLGHHAPTASPAAANGNGNGNGGGAPAVMLTATACRALRVVCSHRQALMILRLHRALQQFLQLAIERRRQPQGDADGARVLRALAGLLSKDVGRCVRV